jgi:hypothetical protein
LPQARTAVIALRGVLKDAGRIGWQRALRHLQWISLSGGSDSSEFQGQSDLGLTRPLVPAKAIAITGF